MAEEHVTHDGVSETSRILRDMGLSAKRVWNHKPFSAKGSQILCTEIRQKVQSARSQ